MREEVAVASLGRLRGYVSYVNSSDEACYSWGAVEAEEIKGVGFRSFPASGTGLLIV